MSSIRPNISIPSSFSAFSPVARSSPQPSPSPQPQTQPSTPGSAAASTPTLPSPQPQTQPPSPDNGRGSIPSEVALSFHSTSPTTRPSNFEICFVPSPTSSNGATPPIPQANFAPVPAARFQQVPNAVFNVVQPQPIKAFQMGMSTVAGDPNIYRENAELTNKKGADIEACFTEIEQHYQASGLTVTTIWPHSGKVDLADAGGNPHPSEFLPTHSKEGEPPTPMQKLHAICRAEGYKTERFAYFDPDSIGNERGPKPFTRPTPTLQNLRFNQADRQTWLNRLPDTNANEGQVKARRNLFWFDQFRAKMLRYAHDKYEDHRRQPADPHAVKQRDIHKKLFEKLNQLDKEAVWWAITHPIHQGYTLDNSEADLTQFIVNRPEHIKDKFLQRIRSKEQAPIEENEKPFIANTVQLQLPFTGDPAVDRQVLRTHKPEDSLPQDSLEQLFFRLVAYIDGAQNNDQAIENSLVLNRLTAQLTAGIDPADQRDFTQLLRDLCTDMRGQKQQFDGAANVVDFQNRLNILQCAQQPAAAQPPNPANPPGPANLEAQIQQDVALRLTPP